MNLLLIGMSRFAQRRVLPAVAALERIDRLDIASAHARAQDVRHLPKFGLLHSDWREALERNRPGLVYVSTTNSEHATVVRHALDTGNHVVVDKPGLLSLAVVEEVLTVARSSGLVVAEAVCYSFHPVFEAVRSVFDELGTEGMTAAAVFTPPVPPGDFRYDRRKGGGALMDTGPYFASLGRVLWGVEPERLSVVVGNRSADGLDTSYSVLAGYPGGRAVTGHFGFTTLYQNCLRLAGPGFTAGIERAFSIPPDMTAELEVTFGEQHEVRRINRSDSLEIFLSWVLGAIDAGSREFDDPLISDARTLDRLVRAAALP
ncbi:NDP-hexose-3-ketoreductase [Kitasatospora sp. MAA19]|uniref:Gfo/Idh/MocA family protein n=1 Tax=unclassified Kitasatospora TaxID=2633591 RepID=UPI002472E913|nr:Gfo/Idh/MocA family oxidoreductase [Kitasatospora sp. MAA19]MDH6709077.1 NDP-hexose-3-ketoreductase [Kitasatospora sp. MAA19]